MLMNDPKTENTNQSAIQLDKKASYWQPYIMGYQQSTSTKREYCDEHQINYPQFLYWSRKLVPEEACSPAASFVPVKIKSAALNHEALATLELGDKRLLIHSEAGLHVLLNHLG